MTSRSKGRSRSSSGSRKRPALPSRAEQAAEARRIGQLYGHIYRVVRKIPRGRIATYGQVAELAGVPGAARVVGAAMKASLPDMALPWQRVVGKRSAIQAWVRIHDPIGAATQRALLEDEGVEISESGGISLRAYGWLPADRGVRGPTGSRPARTGRTGAARPGRGRRSRS